MLLGVGCQKGGTTWLRDYLAASPQVDGGFLKEYHLFDVLDGVTSRSFLLGVMRQARAATRSVERGRPAQSAALRRAAFYADPDLYVEYMEALLARPGVRVAMDVTPGYAGLSADRLRTIRASFMARGIAVRVVFLMRDPVERLWSAIRMDQRRHGERGEGSVEEAVRHNYDSDFHESRGRYEDTLASLTAAFADEELFVELYETLFREDTLSRLADFLAIDAHPADTSRRLNTSPKTEPLSEDTRRLVARHYRATYTAAMARLGESTIMHHWPSARLL